MDRTKKSIKNIAISVISQIVIVMFVFFSRTIFIKLLGLEYLGITNVLYSILTILSVAELGIGEAISYALYKPLSENNFYKIAAIMSLIKKTYLIIAGSVFVVGLFIMPFLQFIIGESINTPNIYLVYFLFVLNSAVSYLFSYKRVLLVADQKKFIEALIHTIVIILMYITQIIVLLLLKNYLYYIILQVVFTILENILVSFIVSKKYSYLKSKESSPLGKDEKKHVFRNFYALAIQRVQGVIAQSIDSIILSIFLGTVLVGVYSNYMTIEKYMNTFLVVVFTALSGSVGNLIATESKEKVFAVFKKIFYYGIWIYGVCTICFFALANNFILAWLTDEKFFIDISVLFFISYNFYILGCRHSITLFKNAYGLYWQDRYKPIINVFINIILSVVLTYFYGMIGVCIGTFISYFLTNVWVEPLVLYKHGFKKKVAKYFLLYFLLMIFNMLLSVSFYSILKLIAFSNPMLNFFVNGVICFVIANAFYIVILWNTGIFKPFFRRIFKKSNKHLGNK